MVLQRLVEFSEKWFGREPRSLPIPETNAVILVDEHRAARYYSTLEQSVAQLSASYRVNKTRKLQGLLRSFVMKGGADLSPLHTFRLRDQGCECYWLTFTFAEKVREGRAVLQTEAIRHAVIADLPFDAGNVLIRPERLQDKISELFGPIDVDFKGQASFSRSYFVLADNEKRLRDNLPSWFMERMAEHPGLFVRICGNSVLISRDSAFHAADALELARLGFIMTQGG